LIFKSDNNVKGLTTAATVWAVAAIGMTAGGGMYALSTAATGLTIIILVGVHYLEFWMEQIKLTRTYQIKMTGSFSEEELIDRYFTEKIKILETKSFKENEHREFYFTIQAPKKTHQDLVNELIDNIAVIELKY
jgi:putative Mg2+ transporter-C (MgtC) family protein